MITIYVQNNFQPYFVGAFDVVGARHLPIQCDNPRRVLVDVGDESRAGRLRPVASP